MQDFRGTTVEEVVAQVRSGEVTARQQVEIALAVIEARDATVHAFIAVDADAALAAADDVDARVRTGDDAGSLAGVPIAVKDIEHAAGFVTTSGSRLHADDAPATFDSALVERLKDAGAIVVGKTNTPEFGWQADTSNDLFPSTVNPWDTTRSAGGSSGGSGAAIAAGMVPLATGSDGGGSIRIPSAVNGLSGLKPSLGRVPLGGPNPPRWLHLSCPGPMARRIRDVAVALDAVVGPDPTDLHSLPMPKGDSWRGSLEHLLPPRRVLWSPNLGYGTVDSEIEQVCAIAVGRLADKGVEVVEVDVFDEDPVIAWASIAYGGILRTVADLRGTERWELLGGGLRQMLDLVAEQSATDVLRSLDAGHHLNCRLIELFHEAPLLLCPTVAGQTGRVGHPGTVDGDESQGWVAFTYPFNLTGNPAGSVCAGFTADGMPVGLQVVGPRHGDVAVLRAIAVIEDLLDLDTIAPLGWSDA